MEKPDIYRWTGEEMILQGPLLIECLKRDRFILREAFKGCNKRDR